MKLPWLAVHILKSSTLTAELKRERAAGIEEGHKAGRIYEGRVANIQIKKLLADNYRLETLAGIKTSARHK